VFITLLLTTLSQLHRLIEAVGGLLAMMNQEEVRGSFEAVFQCLG
jgi:hypothetical protein